LGNWQNVAVEITTHPVEMKYNRLLQQAAAGWMEETLGSVSSIELATC
jgi:hypothetical protein